MIALATSLITVSGWASVLEWNQLSYSGGSTSTTYNNVDGSGVNINVSVSWDNTYNNPFWAPSNPNPFNPSYNGSPSHPDIDPAYTGGQGGGAESLLLRVPSTDYNTYGSWTYLNSGFADEDSVLYITFTFSQAVTGVDFGVWDVDYANNDYQDLVIVSGSDGINTYTPTTTNIGAGSSNQVSPGQALGTGASNGDSSAGNAYFDFGGAEVTSVTVAYTNGNASPTFPDGQAIAIGNVFFTAVPEADAAWALLPLGLFVGMGAWRRKRRAAHALA